MEFSIVPVSRVFKTYQGQARIADLNKKSSVKRAQGQKDQVIISSSARQALQKNPRGDAPVPTANLEAVASTSKSAPAASGDFVPGI
ncbi:MAG TPA: hypothetical protein HPP54_01400 [Nitrospinae bacterium]|jgi:hypothetical protein|nr:hypothetical protein [Nitrospinota bacterium]